MSDRAWRRLVALCVTGAVAGAFWADGTNGVPHVHPPESDIVGMALMFDNSSPAVTGSVHP